MRLGRLVFLDTTGTSVAELPGVLRTETAVERSRGLLKRPSHVAAQGMLIDGCNAVHTIGMAYAIDLVYIGRDGFVRKVVPAVRPWRMSGCFRAAMTLELCAGMSVRLGLEPGQRTRWYENDSSDYTAG